jgi:ABC-type glycerol-3-phosphate transport system permease component
VTLRSQSTRQILQGECLGKPAILVCLRTIRFLHTLVGAPMTVAGGDTPASGYLPVFFEWNVWGYLPTAIIVLVAIDQPFTLWMLHSSYKNIPQDLDESAMVDGCTRFQAFRHVIIPVMWPGVITTGLFSFLLAYDDFAVTAMILDKENQTRR